MRLALAAASVLLLAACSAQKSVTATNVAKNPVYSSKLDLPSKVTTEPAQFNILFSVPFSTSADVAPHLKQHCYLLGRQLSNSVRRYAPKNNIEIIQVNRKPSTRAAYVKMTLVEVFSSGNAFIGYRETASVLVGLYLNGKLVKQVYRTRDASGGFKDGVKKSCVVLARAVNTLGDDIGKWLATIN